jgi:AcrR family transcriptional regulator
MSGPANDGWRQRAVQRFPHAARERAESRGDRFMKSTIAIMGETGGTDFTVQQVVSRSRTSIRAFYQHFGSKDELLLAVLEEIMAINRALTLYNQHLAETRPQDAARVLSPLHELVGDILSRGVAEKEFRADLDVEMLATIIMHTMLSAVRLRALGGELTGTPVGSADLYELLIRGIGLQK